MLLKQKTITKDPPSVGFLLEVKMANMSYCRFRNTLSDLNECYSNIENETSEEEEKAKEALIKLCKKIAHLYNDDEEDA